MEAVFLKLVNMSIAASYLVLAVAAVRLMFRKIPKWLLCLLWGLVALRLLCPLRLQSALSLIPSAQTLPEEILYTARPEIQSGIAPVDAVVNGALETSMPPADPTASANPTQIWSFLLSRVWLAGVGVLLLYAVGSVLLLRRRVATAIPVGKNIKRSEFVDTPFVLGLLHPVIYLPACLAEEDIPFVIAHEETHIRRGDPWWKLLGFGLLCVYWFNPVMWLAYVLLCRDIEGACDERVIRDMPLDARRAYSLALFHCSIRRPRATAPLAFGEVGVKERVKNVMNYKKPAFWAVAVAAILGIVLSVCFLTDPIRVSEVTGISLRGRRLVSLTDAQTDTMLSILRELEGTPEQIPQTDGFDVITIDIQSPQGSRLVNTLPDCACVWEEGGTAACRVTNPAPLRNYLEQLTQGVENRQTRGEPFAVPGEPWVWTKKVTSGAVKTAKAAVWREGYYSNRAISQDTLERLLTLLNQLPREVFTGSEGAAGDKGCSLTLQDGVNNLAVVLRYAGGSMELMYGARVWGIQNEALGAFLEDFCDHSAGIQYTVGGRWDWQTPLEFGYGDFSMRLRLVEGWEYEEVPYAQGSTGIRCRPAGQTGWLYFSYWPEGYAPQETERIVLEGSFEEAVYYVSYPAAISAPGSFTTEGAIWSYRRMPLSHGDYAVINEGAEGWFTRYQDQIEAITLFAEESVEG